MCQNKKKKRIIENILTAIFFSQALYVVMCPHCALLNGDIHQSTNCYCSTCQKILFILLLLADHKQLSGTLSICSLAQELQNVYEHVASQKVSGTNKEDFLIPASLLAHMDICLAFCDPV